LVVVLCYLCSLCGGCFSVSSASSDNSGFYRDALRAETGGNASATHQCPGYPGRLSHTGIGADAGFWV
jgi:hypothetical protein